jgi:hypothetical protein
MKIILEGVVAVALIVGVAYYAFGKPLIIIYRNAKLLRAHLADRDARRRANISPNVGDDQH